MINKLKKTSKIIFTIAFILLLSLFIYARITNQEVWAAAKSAAQTTADSVARGTTAVAEWNGKKDSDGKVILKNPSAPTLSELVDSSQVRDGGIYITYEDLISIPSLFCSAKGVALPGMGSTVVTSGGRSTSTTDQGKETAYLTTNDIPASTVFRNLNEWTDFGASYTTKYENTTSKTLAKFNLAETRLCTPAEAWVLAEFDNNVPGKTATIVSNTGEEYTGPTPSQTLTTQGNTMSTFIDNVRSIAKFAKSNGYEFGDSDTIPLDKNVVWDKKINNTHLIKWALYSCGYDVGDESVEDYCKSQGFTEITNIDDLQAGDILFLNRSGEEGIVIFAADNKIYDLSSNDKIKLENAYSEYNSQPIKADIGSLGFRVAYRLKGIKGNNVTAATSNDATKTNIDGQEIYIVGNPGEEKYVRKEGNKFYYVQISDEYAPYTYVQHAWWKKKTVGHNADSASIKDTDLANEATDFENYIKQVTGVSDVSKLERNEDTTFKIDYKVSFEPEDTSKVQTRFNSDTNKYIVGPFKVNYLRAVTKQGDRPKVSFSGISNSILVGTDAQGNELVDEDGNSVLQLGKNYRFVYSNTNDESTNYGHDTARNALDTDEDYPYPSSGEEFYIEIDYLDNLAKIKNFKFDFQYLTAGGKYEYYKGNFLEIHWTQDADVQARVVSSGTGSANVGNVQSVAVASSRDDNENMVGSSAGATGGNFTFTETRGMNLADPKEENGFGGTWRMDVIYDGCEARGDDIIVKGHIEKNWYSTTSDDTISLQSVSTSNGTYSVSGNSFTVTFKRDYTKARVNESYPISIKAHISGGQSGRSSTEECTVNADLYYENKLLGNSATIKSSGSKVEINGNKIFVKGVIDNEEQTIDFDAKMIHSETPQTAIYSWWTEDGDCLEVKDESKGVFTVKKPGKCKVGCATGDGLGASVEVKLFEVEVPELCLDTSEKRETAISLNGSGSAIAVAGPTAQVSYYNATKKLTGNYVFSNTLGSPVMALPLGDKIFFSVNNLSTYVINGSTYAPVIFTFTDNDGKKVKITANWTPKTSTGQNVTDGTDDTENDSTNDGQNSNNGQNTAPSASTPTNVGAGLKLEYKYCYYLRATSATIKTAQDQINAVGSHEVIDVDAENGLNSTVSGTPVELEFLSTDINLRTHLSGMVWIDNDEQKDQSIGTLGVKDSGEKYADDNSVEIVVWKVKYQKDGDKLTEVERTKAIAWDEEGKKIDFIDNRIYIKDGKYSIPEIQVPAEEGLDTSKYVMSYDVEFVYDGQTYEATEYLKSSGKDSVSDKIAEFKKTAEETKGEDSDYSKIKGTSAKTDYSLDSYIVENADERKDFDSYFTEFYGSDSTSGNPGNSPINEDGTTNGKATGGAGQSQYNYVEKGEEANKTADLQYTSTDVGTSEADTKKASILVTHDDKGFVYDQYKFAARTSEGGLVFPYETKYHVEKKYYDNLTFQKNAYKPVDEYFNQINLGLLERYHTDISVLKDLYKAKVVVDEQETDYTYNSLGALTEDSINKTVLAGYREKTYNIGLYNADYKYRSSVYNTITDPITKTVLKAIKDETELRLFVTYKVQIYNGSEYTDVSINEFKDYYDDSLTMVGLETDNKNITGYISTSNQSEQARAEQVLAEKPYARKLVANKDVSKLYKWNKTDDLSNEYIDKLESDNTKPAVFGENDDNDLKFEKIESGKDGYKAARCTGLSALSSDKKSVNGDLMLEPGEVYEIYITYEVDQSGYKQIQDAKAADPNNAEAGKDVERKALLDDKKNIFEVSRYTSAYTQEGVNRHKTTSYKAGQISGRVDRDSAPDNVNMSLTNADDKSKINSKYFEDDTEAAPVVHVGLKGVDEQRILNGVVWEDLRDNYGEGDGIYKDGETLISGVDVTMVEKINVTNDDFKRIKDYIENNQATITAEERAQFGNLTADKFEYEFEYIWPDGTFDNFNSTTRSEGGKYEFKNFVAGNYVVRFEYGNNEENLKYNGQDYRNTAYQTGQTNAAAQTDAQGAIYNGTTDGLNVEAGKVSTLNNQWHDLSNNEQANEMNNARVSDARDYEPRRLMVDAYSRTITNKNAEVLAAYTDDADTNLTNEYKAKLAENNAKLMENTSMVANTAKFVVDIEKQSEIKYEENSDNTEGANTSGNEVKHEYVIGNMDFGLVRRAETRIYTQKEISKIELLKNDGKEVVLSVSCDDEGNIIKAGGTTDENKTVRVDKITGINKETLAAGTQGFKYVAVEASYLKGLQVKLTYKITVTNKSENDYTTQYIANIKDARELYKTAVNYQAYGSAKEEDNPDMMSLSPFNTGKGIVYGKYVGLHYYTNSTEATGNKDLTEKYKFAYNGQSTDVIVKTTVDQIVDYIDNDISISKEDTENIANQTWVESSAKDREEKLSSMSYVENTDKTDTNNVKDDNLVDNKGRKYVGTGKNNIVLTENENMTAEPETIDYEYTELTEQKDKDGKVIKSEKTGNSLMVPVTKVENGEIIPSLVSTEDTDKTVVMYTTINDSVVSGTVSKYNTEFTKELAPTDKTSISIVTTAQASEEAIKNMNYDNLMEIVMYSNPVGRRDTTAIPGNANMIAKQEVAYKAGYDRRYETMVTDEKNTLPTEAKEVVEDENGEKKTYYFLPKSVEVADSKSETGKKEITTERDAYAAKDTVTFSEPTGLSLERQKANMAIRIILLSLIIAAVGIMIATVVVVFRKTKYDDTDLLSGDRK